MLPFSLKQSNDDRWKKIPKSHGNILIAFRNHRGFTWLELLVVLVIMGIISAVAASRLMYDEPELAGQTEVMKVYLRYAQLRSINTDTVWYIQFAANSYALYKSGEVNPVLLPGGDAPTINLPAGLVVNFGFSNIVSFDSWGKPCSDAAALVLQTTDRTINFTMGSQTRSIVITKNTGFIQ